MIISELDVVACCKWLFERKVTSNLPTEIFTLSGSTDDRTMRDLFLASEKVGAFCWSGLHAIIHILQLRIIPPSLIDAGADGGAISHPR